MQYVTAAGNVGGFFAPPNPLTGQVPVLVSSAFLNDILGNLMQLLIDRDIAPVAGNYGQILAAMNDLIAAQLPSAEAVAEAAAETFATSVANTAQAAAEGVAAAALAAAFPVANAGLAAMADGTLKANFSGAASAPQDVTLAALLGKLGWSYGADSNGSWEKRPDGLITCKGSMIASMAGNSTYEITLPTPFPNSFKSGRLTSFNSAAVSSVQVWPEIVTLPGAGDFTQIEIYLNQQGGGGPTAGQGVSFEFEGT